MIRLLRLFSFKYSATRTLTLHEDILSLQEINQAISTVVPTLDKQFLLSIRNGEPSNHLWNQLRRGHGLNILTNDTAILMLQSLNSQKQTNSIINQIYDSFIKLFKSRLSQLSLPQIASILQDIENEIYERLQNGELLIVLDAEKILRAYQYCSYGSAVLYKSIAYTFKVAQFETNPLKLSEYCKLFSKCKENTQGAFGLYKITEQRLVERIRDYDFHDLVKIANSFYSVNIGSNDFQIMLEERISDQFPSNENIDVSDLVRIVRATSKYLFRYNSLALYNQISASVLHLLPHMTNKQISYILWSLMRSQRGSIEIYIVAEEEIKKRVQLFTMRQLTLLYLASCGHQEAKYINEDILLQIKHRISQIDTNQDIQTTLQNQLLQVLGGILIGEKEIQLQQLIIDLIIKQKIKISQSIKIQLLQASINATLNEHSIQLILHILSNIDQEIQYEEILIVGFIKRTLGRYFTNMSIQSSEQVKKQVFHLALHLNPFDQHLHQVLGYLCDQHLTQMRFVFKQDHWVIIAWNILVNTMLFKQPPDPRVMEQVCLGIKEINPNIICSINLIKYIECLIMINQFEKKPLTDTIRKLQKIIKRKQEQLIQNSILLHNNKDEAFLNSISQVLLQTINGQIDAPSKVYVNLFEQQFLQFIPSALVLQVDSEQLKFCLIPVYISDFDSDFGNFNLEDFYSKKYTLRRELQIQIYVLRALGWNAEFIVQEEWEKMNSTKQNGLIKKLFTLEILVEGEQKNQKEQQNQVHEQKGKKEKLQRRNLREKQNQTQNSLKYSSIYEGEINDQKDFENDE